MINPVREVLPVKYQTDVVGQNGYEVDDVHQLGHEFKLRPKQIK